MRTMTEGTKPSANMFTDKTLAGQHAVVTGGTRGIGATVSEYLARMGAKISLTARNPDTLEVHAEALRNAHGAEVFTNTGDMSKESDIVAAFEGAVDAPRAAIRSAVIAVDSDNFRARAKGQWIDPLLGRGGRRPKGHIPAGKQPSTGRGSLHPVMIQGAGFEVGEGGMMVRMGAAIHIRIDGDATVTNGFSVDDGAGQRYRRFKLQHRLAAAETSDPRRRIFGDLLNR